MPPKTKPTPRKTTAKKTVKVDAAKPALKRLKKK